MRLFSTIPAFLFFGSLIACSSPDAGRGDTGKTLEVTASNGASGGAGAKPGSPGGGSASQALIDCDPKDPASECAEQIVGDSVCGDGKLSDEEACDDGNQLDDDGCNANCRGILPGYSCVKPGALCYQIARCGDGVLVLPELCDDGNQVPGDGCSASCKVEIGWKCEPGQACEHTVCGDNLREGAESCDDGNAQPFDGCAINCQAEPDCSEGACKSDCGDGLVLGEDCDDGNLIDGDGCSSTCKIEPGFTCEQAPCEMVNGQCVLNVPTIFRDFNASHQDFEPSCDGLVEGVVQKKLVDGHPKLAGPSNVKACIKTADSFGEWYTDGPGRTTIVSSIQLFPVSPDGTGGFVNRYGPMGEQWLSYANQQYNCLVDCVPCVGEPQTFPMRSCTKGNVVTWDGNPLFFPIDDAPGGEMRYAASIPAGYYGWARPNAGAVVAMPNVDPLNVWFAEEVLVPNAMKHNFYFTTEVKYWFNFEADTQATLTFTGDDDVWVFVNGILAADLGGAHVPLRAEVQINTGTAGQYELEPGNAYQVSVFHAERKLVGSSFQLTLDGFDASRSECKPECGDGIIGLGEECDDGINDGGYGECDKGCVLGPYCGDGMVQEPEHCDDGNNIDGDECPSACRRLKPPTMK